MGMPGTYGQTEVVTTTIASSGTTSSAINIFGKRLVGIVLPAALTGTSMTLTAATTLGGTYKAVTDSNGSAVTLTVAASKFILLPPNDYAALTYFKLVSGSAEASDRTIEVIVAPL